MWWRFLTFCFLVCVVLFIVLSCIHGRPVIHLFFHRCCEEDIENDQVIYENFGNNFLRERLVGGDIVVLDNDSFVSSDEVNEVIAIMRKKVNVHDLKSRASEDSGEMTTQRNGERTSPLMRLVNGLQDKVKLLDGSEMTTEGHDNNYKGNKQKSDLDLE